VLSVKVIGFIYWSNKEKYFAASFIDILKLRDLN